MSLGSRPGGDWANTWHWKNVLKSLQTGNNSIPSYCHILFLIAFLEKAFIRNIIITLCINYIIKYALIIIIMGLG